MSDTDYDLIAVGGGTAGLVTAAGAAYLGARPALVERSALGGDCLWTGCVPSKALLASARLAHGMARAGDLGLVPSAPDHPSPSVFDRLRGARARVAEHDDPERFRRMGVDVLDGEARFLGPGLLEVEGVGRLRSSRIVLCTGARPAVPPVEGLEEAGYLTTETLFEREGTPSSLVVLGGGPVGIEMAQAHARLGVEVVVVEMAAEILPGEDTEAARRLREILEGEGIRFLLGSAARRVQVRDGGRVVVTEGGREAVGEALLVATGRRPATEGLGLDRAGVELDGSAVRVDAGLRTTARGVWAAGDVTGGPQFTHVAEYDAKKALRNALLPFRSRADRSGIPRVTYTDPELGQVGLGAAAAEERGGRTFRYAFADLDRSIVEAETEGWVSVHVDRKGRILGATVLGTDAGELIFPLVLALRHGLSLADLSDTVFPYPTRMEALKRTSDAYQRSRLEGTAGRILRRVVRWLT